MQALSRFSADEVRRYSRQILLSEVGGRGQERLRAARPVLVGGGALSKVAADYLIRAGVVGLQVMAPTTPALRTLLLVESPPATSLWAACDGPRGEVGTGCPCTGSLRGGDGEAGFATGAALALQALKLLLHLPVIAHPASAPSIGILRFDFASGGTTALHCVPPCTCGGAADEGLSRYRCRL